jgi:hypothetical protein
MPTIDVVGPYRLFFYSNEGQEAPHVHVQREGLLAKFWLEPVALAASRGFAAHELRKIEEIVAEGQVKYLEAWHEYFA